MVPDEKEVGKCQIEDEDVDDSSHLPLWDDDKQHQQVPYESADRDDAEDHWNYDPVRYFVETGHVVPCQS